MKTTRSQWAVAAALGAGIAITAHAASFDIGRALDAARGVVGGVTTATTDIPEKQEITIGRDVAGTVLGAAPLVNDPALQRYVNRVGRWIAAQSERPDLPWRFGVVDTPGINAFAAPGGYVLVTRGLYELLENESQLAGVLGHEIAHILKRHHITVMQKQGLVQAGASVAQGLAGQQRGAGGVVGQYAAGALGEVFTKGLDQSAEFEADHLGVVLAARAGYNAFGLVEVLHKLQARAAEPTLALLVATHPHPGDRLSKLGELMTPHVAQLPAGAEPAIQKIAASAGPARPPARSAAPAGARAMQGEAPDSAGTQSEAAPQANPLGIDPGSLLRGLIRR